MGWISSGRIVRFASFAIPVGAVFIDCVADLAQIKRGDVIAFISPKDPSERLIKRVIALQGDAVLPRKGTNVVRIPPGHCWVEGDNHKTSLDSNTFGPVAMGLMVAKATHIVWPPQRIAAIESRLPPGRGPVSKHLCLQCFSEEESRLLGVQHNPDDHDTSDIFV
ncbi:mitochondrial inner membrane protease subunit 2-like isoform X2 [Varroa destructor]|uniref:Mitochondrial inner membrane protease subunit 2 n=1 Tax=Varroa destructor TaxID=109461 RepID=A0A7M7KI59_VARDE|nr:mitochondrial inner membrane protease subunit 2-like isoform X2 [Varroa destructor]